MLAECNVARKAGGMRPLLVLLFVPLLLVAPQACRPQPEGTLKAQVHRGLTTLRDALADEGHDRKKMTA